MKNIRTIFATLALLAVSFTASAQWPTPHTDEAGYTVENYQDGRSDFGASWGDNVTGKFIYHLGSKGNDQVAYTQNGTITLKNGAVFILEICTNDNVKWAWSNTSAFRPCFFVVESGAKLIVRRAPGYTGTLQFDGWAQAKGYECIRVHQGGVAEISNAKFVNFHRQTGLNVDDNGNTALNGGYERMGSAARVEGKLTLNDCEIWGGKSYMGGAVTAHQTGEIYINGGSIHDCEAGGRGGAVLVSSLNSYIPNSTTGLPTDNHGTARCEIRGTRIYNNTAREWGGGVYCWWKNTTLVMDDNTDIYNNHTTNYGGSGVVVADYGSAVINKVTIRDHTITSTTANRGAGLYVAGTAGGSGEITIGEGAVIKDNKANTTNGIGGGIYVAAGSKVIMEGGTVSGNQAATQGGGIYLAVNSSNSNYDIFTMKNTASVNGNSCNSQGAGIYVAGGNVKIEGGYIGSNMTPTEGGGLYNAGGTITFSDGTIGMNAASNHGGGIYLKSGEFIMNGLQASLYANRAVRGGGLYVENGKFTMVRGRIENNHADNDGGGVYIKEGAQNHTIQNGVFQNNSAGTFSPSNSSTWDDGWGGGLYIGCANATLTVSGGIFRNNHAGKGGGIYVNASSSTVNINDISTESNQSTYGAFMFVRRDTKSVVNLKGGSIGGNISQWNGGAIFVDNDNTLNIIGSELNYNTSAGGKGGAVFAQGTSAKVNMTGGRIESNTALLGGGIGLINGAVMTYSEGGFIRSNRALKDPNNGSAGFGGGVWLGQENGSTGTATINFVLDTTNPFGFYSNYAEGAGDDIYATGDHTKITVPDISSMDLSEYPYAHDKLYWVEDYRENDPDYANGTRLNTTGNIERYRAATAAFHPTYSVRNISTDASLQTKYLALVLGYELRTIKIRRQGLIPGENAIYFINAVSGNFKQKVMVKGTEAEIDEVTIKGIPSGQYTVTESDWTWYKTDESSSATVRTQWVESEPIFNFANTHRPENTATVPVHDESMKAK